MLSFRAPNEHAKFRERTHNMWIQIDIRIELLFSPFVAKWGAEFFFEFN